MPATMEVIRTERVQVPGLADKIKSARLNDSRSITRICAEVGMTTSNWYRIESGKQSIPLETLRKIEQALGVDFGVKFD